MKSLKNAKQLILLFGVLVCVSYLSSCQTANNAAKAKEEPQVSGETSNSKSGLYRAMAEGVTKQCPLKVDEATTLTKLEYKEEQHALAYTYLFSGGVYEELDAQTWAVVQKTATEMLKEKLKTNQPVSQVRSDDLTLMYIYKDKNDKELFTVTLLPGEY